MTYKLKTFMALGPLINNSIGQTAAFGELSDMGMTYSKTKELFISTDFPGQSLLVFSSKITDADIAVDTDIQLNVHTVINRLIEMSNLNGVPELTRATLLSQVLIDSGMIASNFDCGVIGTDGVRWLPQWISWQATGVTKVDNRITVWLSDAAFRGQFDEYSVTVIPPIVGVDQFFQTAANVLVSVNEVTADTRMDLVQAAKADSPETSIRAFTFNYVDPLNASNKIATVWTTLIYGAAGDNLDSVKSEIINYVLANSTHAQGEWEGIFPDLFKRTEFMIFPMWSKLALEQRLPSAAIYSPILNLNLDVAMMKTWIAGAFPIYDSAHLANSLELVAHPFRSLNLIVTGSKNNVNNKYLITDWFADYIAVPNTSIDFSRMATATCNWANLLTEALIVAETWNSSSTLPSFLRKVNRGGIDLLTFTHANINYFVYPKNGVAYAA